MKDAMKTNLADKVKDFGNGPKIKKGNKLSLGSCNFCDRTNYKIVYEVTGKSLLIRFCGNCLKHIKKVKL